MQDIHSERALAIFGEVTPDTRARAKIIGYLQAYSATEVTVSRTSGRYPTITGRVSHTHPNIRPY